MSAHERPHAEHVGRAVLFHLRPNGGSYSDELTTKRIGRLLADGIDADTLYQIMTDAAAHAAEDAERERSWTRQRIAHDLERLNDRIDSASLARYIDTLKENTP